MSIGYLEVKNICCIGAGYVGGPTMSVIASKCPDITINVVDLNEDRISKWNSEDLKDLPVFEQVLTKSYLNSEIKSFFSTDIDRAWLKQT